jgi:endonuclease G
MRPIRLAFWLSLSIAVCGILPACALDDGAEDLESAQEALTLAESFEADTKGSYAVGDVSLASGTWTLDDALLGSLAGDVKNGSQAVRLRGSGTATMAFDRTSGAGTVTVKYASYGSDASGSFALYRSTDGGASWTKTGASYSTSVGSFATASFAVNVAGTIRFQLRKTDGGSNRIDLDDFSVGDYGGSTPPPAPDAGTDPTPPPSGTNGASISVHTKLGLPSASTTGNWNSYLSVKAQYVMSYNSARKVPNWVSWELNTSELGSAARQNNYRSDSTLPSAMPQATPADYSGSGWDRGHMCPSGDRTQSTTANGQTFYLSNMVPQASNNNSGPWEKLETYERTLAESGKEVMIVAGGVYSASSRKIGASVSVPDSTWKVVVVLDHTGDGAAQVRTTTRVIAVLMPNDDARISTSDSWQSYRVSVRTLESATHFNFLADVPQSIQDVVETRVDNL